MGVFDVAFDVAKFAAPIAVGALAGPAAGAAVKAGFNAIDGKPSGSPASVGTPPFVGNPPQFGAILAALENVADKLPDKLKEEGLEKLEKKILKEVDDPSTRKRIKELFDKLEAGKAEQGAATCPA